MEFSKPVKGLPGDGFRVASTKHKRRIEMDSLTKKQNLDDSDELTSSADKQLEERLAQAAEVPSALKPALGSSPSDGHTRP